MRVHSFVRNHINSLLQYKRNEYLKTELPFLKYNCHEIQCCQHKVDQNLPSFVFIYKLKIIFNVIIQGCQLTKAICCSLLKKYILISFLVSVILFIDRLGICKYFYFETNNKSIFLKAFKIVRIAQIRMTTFYNKIKHNWKNITDVIYL